MLGLYILNSVGSSWRLSRQLMAGAASPGPSPADFCAGPHPVRPNTSITPFMTTLSFVLKIRYDGFNNCTDCPLNLYGQKQESIMYGDLGGCYNRE